MEEVYEAYLERCAELIKGIEIKTGDDILALVIGSIDMLVMNTENMSSIFSKPIATLLYGLTNGLSSEQSTSGDSSESDGEDNKESRV